MFASYACVEAVEGMLDNMQRTLIDTMGLLLMLNADTDWCNGKRPSACAPAVLEITGCAAKERQGPCLLNL